MTRTERIQKLARAVVRYRGEKGTVIAMQGTSKEDHRQVWKIPPDPHAKADVKRWLERLHVDPVEGLKVVDALEYIEDFHAWLDKIAKYESR